MSAAFCLLSNIQNSNYKERANFDLNIEQLSSVWDQFRFQMFTMFIFCVVVALYEYISFRKNKDLIGILIKYFQKKNHDDQEAPPVFAADKRIGDAAGPESSCSTPDGMGHTLKSQSVVIQQNMLSSRYCKKRMDFTS